MLINSGISFPYCARMVKKNFPLLLLLSQGVGEYNLYVLNSFLKVILTSKKFKCTDEVLNMNYTVCITFSSFFCTFAVICI